MKPESLTEKYRPATLGRIVGQSYAVEQLQDFIAQPYPQAFLFSGPTGVGKTTAALAMVREMGVSRDFDFLHIKSGELDQASVESALSTVRRIGVRDGWKVILCDEADMMSSKARSLWLSALEDLQCGEYGRTVIIFTTNDPGRFDARFRDRCECLEFDGNPDTLRVDAQELLDDLWAEEFLPGQPPRVTTIKGLVQDGALSFRRIVRFVESQSRRPVNLATVRKLKLAGARPMAVGSPNSFANSFSSPSVNAGRDLRGSQAEKANSSVPAGRVVVGDVMF